MSDEERGAAAAEQYFAERPHARSARHRLRFLYRGELLSFVVDTGVFASHGLDPGTALLIEHLAAPAGGRILDLGCGWGPVGVAAAKSSPTGSVILTDVNRRAARLAERNLAGNGIGNAEVRVGRLYEPVATERFDLIAANPPYRAGRATVVELLRGAPEHLRPGGRLLIVGKGSQGIRYYQEWLARAWGAGLAVVGRRAGYRVLDVPAPRRPAAEAVKNGTLLHRLPPKAASDRRARARRAAPASPASRTGE